MNGIAPRLPLLILVCILALPWTTLGGVSRVTDGLGTLHAAGQDEEEPTAEEAPSSMEAEPAVAEPQPAAPGGIRLVDNFDDPAAGRLPRTAPDPAIFTRGYLDGEYQVAKVDPTLTMVASVQIPGRYGDVAIAVQVRLVGETRGRAAYVSCRAQSDNSAYRLTVMPDAQEARITRFDGPTAVVLTRSASDAVRPAAEVNRIELGCFAPRSPRRLMDSVSCRSKIARMAKGSRAWACSAVV